MLTGNCAPLILVLNYTDPEEALSVWYNADLSVINRRATEAQARQTSQITTLA